MNLGIFLGVGESLRQMEKSGQKERFISLYLNRYLKSFDKIYLFSYENEMPKLPKNVILIPNKFHLHRFLFAPLIPILNKKEIASCNVIRGFGLTSAVSGILLSKPFVFNWAYDYISFVKIAKKHYYVPFYTILEKLSFLRATKVFVATKLKFNTLKQNKKFVYLPNGVEEFFFKNATLQKQGLVYVGRFEQQKNLFFLIDCVSGLPKSLRFITFVGSGSQEEALKKYAIKKEVQLTIISPVAHSQLPDILKKFAVFTLTSFAEGNSKVLLEAMAQGLVPVVTNFSTAGEVIKDGQDGYIIPFNSTKYSKKLESLLKNGKLTKEIAKKAKQTIKKNFNFNYLITKEIKTLKEAAS